MDGKTEWSKFVWSASCFMHTTEWRLQSMQNLYKKHPGPIAAAYSHPQTAIRINYCKWVCLNENRRSGHTSVWTHVLYAITCAYLYTEIFSTCHLWVAGYSNCRSGENIYRDSACCMTPFPFCAWVLRVPLHWSDIGWSKNGQLSREQVLFFCLLFFSDNSKIFPSLIKAIEAHRDGDPSQKAKKNLTEVLFLRHL